MSDTESQNLPETNASDNENVTAVEAEPKTREVPAEEEGRDNSASDNVRNNESPVSTAKESTAKENAAPKMQPSGRPILLGLILFLLLSLAGATAYFVYLGKNLLAQQDENTQQLAQQMNALHTAQSQSNQSLTQQQLQTKNALLGQIKQLKTALDDTTQRVAAQGARLRAMSDTSRDDWLLAEAEYLLKLANQRIRIERSATGAEALLEEADGILRDLDDPNLHGLRRAIAKDLAALRLVKKIDVEGIYLQLVALTGEIPNIPVIVSAEKLHATPVQQENIDHNAPRDPWAVVISSWKHFVRSFDGYIQIDTQREKPLPLLPVQDQMYLQQNMRLMLERAQLALLREQQNIYFQSLQQADEWLLAYYNKSAEREMFSQTLRELSQRQVVQVLPDISQSLLLIHEYIADLHNLKGIAKPKVREVRATENSAEGSR